MTKPWKKEGDMHVFISICSIACVVPKMYSYMQIAHLESCIQMNEMDNA